MGSWVFWDTFLFQIQFNATTCRLHCSKATTSFRSHCHLPEPASQTLSLLVGHCKSPDLTSLLTWQTSPVSLLPACSLHAPLASLSRTPCGLAVPPFQSFWSLKPKARLPWHLLLALLPWLTLTSLGSMLFLGSPLSCAFSGKPFPVPLSESGVPAHRQSPQCCRTIY